MLLKFFILIGKICYESSQCYFYYITVSIETTKRNTTKSITPNKSI